MSDGTSINMGKAPVHLWIVGAAATLWNCIGPVDYVMTRIRSDAWIHKALPGVDPQIVYNWIDSFPIWAQFGWGLGVWSALAGSLLLLFRHRFAVPAFALSLVGMALSFGYQFFGTKPPAELASATGSGMTYLIIIIGIALYFYARRMRARGALR